MEITGIGNNYSNAYGSTYAAQKNEAEAGTKNTASAQTGNTKKVGTNSVSDYYSYLQKNYDCMSNGNVAISSEYLKKCSSNSAKAKELEDFLKKIPELEQQGYEQLSAQNKALGGTVTYYQQTWMIGKDGSVQSTVYSVTETGMTNAERMKKNMEERLEKQKEKKEEAENMAVTGIGNSYNNVYQSTYAPQKNEAAKKAENTGAEAKNGVSDYYSYLQKNYDCVKNGSVTISGAYLKECTKNPEKAKELEKNLAFFKEGYERGLKSAKANAKTIGARLVNYSESWSIDNTGNITMMASATVTSDGSIKGWRELQEEREEKLKEKKEREVCCPKFDINI